MENKQYPSVLVSTIPSWSERSGANTFATLFEGYPAERLANIYTRADMPNSKVCGRYFRILEGQVIKSIFNRNCQTGAEVERVDTNLLCRDSEQERKRYGFFTKHRWTIFLWLRELGWKLGKWNSTELNDFLDSVNPDVFVFHIESYWYFNRLNNFIIDKMRPKRVIGYLWDDNFTYKQEPRNIVARINRFFTRHQVRNLVSKSDIILAISPKMKEECDAEFGINSILMTKPILTETAPSYHVDENKPIRIVYSGSLVIGRDQTIALLVDCLREINKNGTKIRLDIYSGTALSDNQKKALNVEGCSIVKGHLPQQQVFKEQEQADILLFVENLRNHVNNVARLSFSTKITDYLSRNRTILAIGPKNIAPMEYLAQEDAALTCSSREEIMHTLNKTVNKPRLLEEYAAKAFECGKRNHSRTTILNNFQNIILGKEE